MAAGTGADPGQRRGAPATRRPWLAALALALAAVACAASGEPTRRALIIGVSDYDRLPARSAGGAGPFDLEGPKTDVPRMVRLARDLGVADGELTVLANGIAAPSFPMQAPKHDAILAALADLARRSGPGDQVLVYFSGHGSQSPDLEGDEPDGMDELLLPADIGLWQDDAGEIENAISDDQFGQAIQAIRDRGAYVWVIVDSCHSGTALRGGPLTLPAGFESKGLDASALGVPGDRLRQARTAAAPRAAPAATGDDRPDSGGGIAAFYAATADQAAIGGPQRLADGSLTPSVSLLTFAITEALAGGQVRSYRDLALRVRARYDAFGQLAPEPAFDGEFDRALFGFARVPPRQWPLQRQGTDFQVEGGRLDGLVAGAILAVRDGAQAQAPVLAYLQVTRAGVESSQLQPVAFAGLAATAAQSLRAQAHYSASEAAPGVELALRVARPPAGSAPALEAAIQAVSQGPTANLQFVADGQPADLYLLATGGRLWFADRPQADTHGRAAPPSLPLSADAEAIAARLAAFARSQRLLALLRALEPQAPAGLRAEVRVDTGGRRPEAQACPRPTRQPSADSRSLAQLRAGEPDGVLRLHHCDVVYVTVENSGQQTVDMTPLYFDRDFGISYLESGELDGIRLPAGASHTYVAPISTFDAGAGRALPLGLEELVLVAVPRATGQEAPASYAYLAQGGGAPPVRAAGTASDLDRALDAAGYDSRATRSTSASGAGAGTLRWSWMVAP